MFGYDLGIDLGTNNVVITVPNKGVVINEPSYVAYDTETEKMLYAGRRAYYLQGREPNGITVIQPLKDGVIGSYAMTQQMIKYFIGRAVKKSIFKPRVVASIPPLATDVDRRTLVSVIVSAGARSVCLVEEPLCAAFGAGVDPLQPNGAFVINIGGGTTDMAVVSQGALSQCETVNIAGNTFDEEIMKYVKEKYEVQIGVRSAEDIKKQIGCAVQRNEEIVMVAKGRSAKDGMPKTIEITSNEIYHCLKPLLSEIVAAAEVIFARTSPQLVADIVNSGIILTGGSAELYGMDELFKNEMELDVTIAPQPNLCVAKGASVALDKMRILDSYGYRFQTKEEVRIR